MDDMSAYYPPPSGLHNPHYPYYQPPPPLGAAAAAAPPPPQPVQQLLPPPYHHHHHQHQPPFATYAPPPPPPPYAQPSYDEVRTLFVAGLPEDVKTREIYNLFREFPGYQSSHLRNPTQSSLPFAFAVFADKLSAIGAMQALNGMVFDLEKGSTLYIDLAKANSRSKRSRADDERNGLDKRAKGSADFLRGTPDTSVGSIHMPGMSNSAYNMIGYPSAQSYSNYDGRAVNETTVSRSNAPPCPTLFVANLGPTCTEQELIQVFSRCPGFLKLKMQNTYGSPVAFVDFQIFLGLGMKINGVNEHILCPAEGDISCEICFEQDTPSSSGALNHLQGTILYSSPAGEGMRLEYAKSRMGLRRKHK